MFSPISCLTLLHTFICSDSQTKGSNKLVFLAFSKASCSKSFVAQRNKENSICKAQAEVKYTIVQTSQLCAFLHFLSHSV